MNIDQLDEYQGIEAQMVQEWLRNQGFDMRLGGLLHAGTYLVRWEPIASSGQTTEASLCAVARYRDQSVQTLLREINPRMRKGIPSQAALRAHRGLWLRSVGTESIATVLSRLIEEFPSSRDDGSFFWPCDDNGNKVRWPTDANGEML